MQNKWHKEDCRQPGVGSNQRGHHGYEQRKPELGRYGFWEVRPGEEGVIADLLKQFLPEAQKEPGVKEFQIHQNTSKPGEFFFYEVFAGEAAFAEHQQTRHFKDIIVGQAIPKLAKRERSQFRFI